MPLVRLACRKHRLSIPISRTTVLAGQRLFSGEPPSRVPDTCRTRTETCLPGSPGSPAAVVVGLGRRPRVPRPLDALAPGRMLPDRVNGRGRRLVMGGSVRPGCSRPHSSHARLRRVIIRQVPESMPLEFVEPVDIVGGAHIPGGHPAVVVAGQHRVQLRRPARTPGTTTRSAAGTTAAETSPAAPGHGTPTPPRTPPRPRCRGSCARRRATAKSRGHGRRTPRGPATGGP